MGGEVTKHARAKGKKLHYEDEDEEEVDELQREDVRKIVTVSLAPGLQIFHHVQHGCLKPR